MSDLLAWPVVGAVLRWRHLRTATRTVLLLVAAALVAHGLFGPEMAPKNLATLLTWVHYRGLLVVALLAAGNFFCLLPPAPGPRPGPAAPPAGADLAGAAATASGWRCLVRPLFCSATEQFSYGRTPGGPPR